MADTMSELAPPPPSDPDAQAIVVDFLDYTEYFPSDLFRSLTLIRKLDEAYLNHTNDVHDQTTTYGHLPTIPANQRPDPQSLRKSISSSLEQAIRAREASYAEASRLYQVAERHTNRLRTIVKKLKALPEPPSRDPTPVPVSPQLGRTRRNDTDRPRLTLLLEGNKHGYGPIAGSGAGRPQKGRRKQTGLPVRGRPPSRPIYSSDESDSDIGGPNSHLAVGSEAGEHRPISKIKLKGPKTPRPPKLPKAPRVRPPGVMGTNVHSAVAGISTSNALALLEPPPPDAKPGSRWAPWNKLTEYEMALLRKSMKKNAVWNPSDTMIRKKLSEYGRGRENYEKAKAEAAEKGEPFLDEEPADPNKKVLAPGEINMFDTVPKEGLQLMNRGMKLNEAKKAKREANLLLARAEAMNLDEANSRVAAAALSMKDLFKLPASATATPVKEKKNPLGQSSKSARKRKRDPSPDSTRVDTKDTTSAAQEDGTKPNAAKKIKLLPPAPPQKGATPVPLPSPSVASATATTAPDLSLASVTDHSHEQIPESPTTGLEPSHKTSLSPVISSSPDTKKSTSSNIQAPNTRSRRASIAPAKGHTPTPHVGTTAPEVKPEHAAAPAKSTATTRSSRSSAKAQSAEPAPGPRRRGSNGSTVTTPMDPPVGPALRRGDRRRPVPGTVTSQEEGRPTVTVGKRNKAPNKKGTAKRDGKDGKDKTPAIDEAEDPVDPNEERYCVCHDVSYGVMIQCDNDDCENQWFHLECVGMTGPPAKRAKWYCPQCRVLLHVTEQGRPTDPPKTLRR